MRKIQKTACCLLVLRRRRGDFEGWSKEGEEVILKGGQKEEKR